MLAVVLPADSSHHGEASVHTGGGLVSVPPLSLGRIQKQGVVKPHHFYRWYVLQPHIVWAKQMQQDLDYKPQLSCPELPVDP